MFRRKPKTRLEQAREDLERIREEVQEQAGSAGEDLAGRLRHVSEQLRQEFEHVEDEARERGKAILESLEDLGAAVRGEQKKQKKQGIPWGLVLVAFGVGLVIGIVLNNRK